MGGRRTLVGAHFVAFRWLLVGAVGRTDDRFARGPRAAAAIWVPFVGKELSLSPTGKLWNKSILLVLRKRRYATENLVPLRFVPVQGLADATCSTPHRLRIRQQPTPLRVQLPSLSLRDRLTLSATIGTAADEISEKEIEKARHRGFPCERPPGGQLPERCEPRRLKESRVRDRVCAFHREITDEAQAADASGRGSDHQTSLSRSIWPAGRDPDDY